MSAETIEPEESLTLEERKEVAMDYDDDIESVAILSNN